MTKDCKRGPTITVDYERHLLMQANAELFRRIAEGIKAGRLRTPVAA